MNEMIRVTSDQFDKAVVNVPLTVVDFTANWCPPCRVMDPIFKQMAVEFGNQVQFLIVNGDENPELIGRYSVQSLPTFIFLREGQIVNRLIGSRPKGQFKVEIQNFVEEAYTNTATQTR